MLLLVLPSSFQFYFYLHTTHDLDVFPKSLNLPLIHYTMLWAEAYNSVLKLCWHWSCTTLSHNHLICLISFLLQTQPRHFDSQICHIIFTLFTLKSQHYWVISVCHFWPHIQCSLVISGTQVITHIHLVITHDVPALFPNIPNLQLPVHVVSWVWNEWWVYTIHIWCDWCVLSALTPLGSWNLFFHFEWCSDEWSLGACLFSRIGANCLTLFMLLQFPLCITPIMHHSCHQVSVFPIAWCPVIPYWSTCYMCYLIIVIITISCASVHALYELESFPVAQRDRGLMFWS